jgi:hypothetical protein
MILNEAGRIRHFLYKRIKIDEYRDKEQRTTSIPRFDIC